MTSCTVLNKDYDVNIVSYGPEGTRPRGRTEISSLVSGGPHPGRCEENGRPEYERDGGEQGK